VPPGRCLVLLAIHALWVTSWPFAEYTKHAWAGAWICSMFRNESARYLSSALIVDAVAATQWKWPDTPAEGMVTFVDTSKVRRGNPGYCFQKAGFQKVGHTQGGLVALQLLPADMPGPQPPRHRNAPLDMKSSDSIRR